MNLIEKYIVWDNPPELAVVRILPSHIEEWNTLMKLGEFDLREYGLSAYSTPEEYWISFDDGLEACVEVRASDMDVYACASLIAQGNKLGYITRNKLDQAFIFPYENYKYGVKVIPGRG